MAEISFGGMRDNRIASEKLYVWPGYNAGRVEHIRGVTHRTDPAFIYSKPSSEERDRILSQVKDAALHEYSPEGGIKRSASFIPPGSLFDALV